MPIVRLWLGPRTGILGYVLYIFRIYTHHPRTLIWSLKLNFNHPWFCIVCKIEASSVLSVVEVSVNVWTMPDLTIWVQVIDLVSVFGLTSHCLYVNLKKKKNKFHTHRLPFGSTPCTQTHFWSSFWNSTENLITMILHPVLFKIKSCFWASGWFSNLASSDPSTTKVVRV